MTLNHITMKTLSLAISAIILHAIRTLRSGIYKAVIKQTRHHTHIHAQIHLNQRMKLVSAICITANHHVNTEVTAVSVCHIVREVTQ